MCSGQLDKIYVKKGAKCIISLLQHCEGLMDLSVFGPHKLKLVHLQLLNMPHLEFKFKFRMN